MTPELELSPSKLILEPRLPSEFWGRCTYSFAHLGGSKVCFVLSNPISHPKKVVFGRCVFLFKLSSFPSPNKVPPSLVLLLMMVMIILIMMAAAIQKDHSISPPSKPTSSPLASLNTIGEENLLRLLTQPCLVALPCKFRR